MSGGGESRTVEETCKPISGLIIDEKERESRVRTKLEYVNRTHSAPVLAEKAVKVYQEPMSERWWFRITSLLLER